MTATSIPRGARGKRERPAERPRFAERAIGNLAGQSVGDPEGVHASCHSQGASVDFSRIHGNAPIGPAHLDTHARYAAIGGEVGAVITLDRVTRSGLSLGRAYLSHGASAAMRRRIVFVDHRFQRQCSLGPGWDYERACTAQEAWEPRTLEQRVRESLRREASECHSTALSSHGG
jgi:hypothetical protein